VAVFGRLCDVVMDAQCEKSGTRGIVVFPCSTASARSSKGSAGLSWCNGP
jgi:hypothetical protein